MKVISISFALIPLHELRVIVVKKESVFDSNGTLADKTTHCLCLDYVGGRFKHRYESRNLNPLMHQGRKHKCLLKQRVFQHLTFRTRLRLCDLIHV